MALENYRLMSAAKHERNHSKCGGQVEEIALIHVIVSLFLGITINNKLNWNSHIHKVTNKISKTVGILNKLRYFLPSDVLQTMYNTLILPHLIYGILGWGRHTNVMHNIQKRAIRIIAASKYNAHTEPLFKQLNLLKACDICKLQELKMLSYAYK